MSDLRLVGRSDDGSELELKDQDGVSYTLRISDHLRSLVNQPRLVAVVAPGDAPASITVKEVQARLRAGENADSLARIIGWSPEKIEKFSGPIMQERAYIIELALAAALQRDKHSPSLATATIAQLSPRGVDMDLVEWNTWRHEDGSWNIVLNYPLKDGGFGQANWNFNLQSRSLESLDDGALWISGEEKIARPTVPTHGIVFPSETAAPRLVAVREEIETIRITTTPVAAITPITPTAAIESEEIAEDAKRDGVTKRLKIPSWDDIMFGSKSEDD